MAYRCPVCDVLAPDGEHLAHHLAIVAMTRGGDHEEWLDEHATGWRSEGPETLATFATERAETVEHEFDEGAGERTAPADDPLARSGAGSPGPRGAGGSPAAGTAPDDVSAVLNQAREMTASKLRDDPDDAGESDDADSSDGDGDDAYGSSDEDSDDSNGQ